MYLPYSHLLAEYEKIQYNNIFDQANADSDIFYINGYVPKAAEEEASSENGRKLNAQHLALPYTERISPAP